MVVDDAEIKSISYVEGDPVGGILKAECATLQTRRMVVFVAFLRHSLC